MLHIMCGGHRLRSVQVSCVCGAFGVPELGLDRIGHFDREMERCLANAFPSE